MVVQHVTERVLFVHAHPDDESIATGGTLARLVREGAQVTVLTATRGERGEVVPGPLKILEGTAELAVHRSHELAMAMAAVGVSDQRFLGSAEARAHGLPERIYRDSGMQWGGDGRAQAPDTLGPDDLCAADLDEIAADVVSVIDQLRPTAVVSYDADGGYGHPDHVRVHEATTLAASLTGAPLYLIEGSDAHTAAGAHTAEDAASRRIVDLRPAPENDPRDFAAKRAAMAAHASQLTVEDDEFVLSGGQRHPIGRVESFRRWSPPPLPVVEDVAPTLPQRITTYVVSFVIGAVFGLLGTVAQQKMVMIGDTAVPIGLVLSLLGVTALLVGLRLVLHDRLIVLIAAIGILAVIALLSLPGPGGSVLIPQGTIGLVWTIAPTLVATIVVAWPRIPPRPER
ncbi:DUF6113 family protein [Compostimonas suwonensis]|uniref:N-acetyl-1-D-myo-inositol-2-amino-2-deoxy-alpha-D-glucopyranoside deacetylase n=1 Tax=Compostimonas suwonensis TaxID=1048394 RepID=A0A2M9BWC3_9MICO|nr:DUF6113 family protein [Compostimonas suwonensis]PJJ62257.1 N-acetyl-1-D-myo-inositol-2-amino-2-deoxy-alpha-D-glucopyranoside deacetylase [Compostimonas suwonensis]